MKLGKKIGNYFHRVADYSRYNLEREIAMDAKKSKASTAIAIVSIVFGVIGVLTICVFGLGFFPGLIAIILSIMSLCLSKNPTKIVALVGLVCGIISVILSIAVFIISYGIAANL